MEGPYLREEMFYQAAQAVDTVNRCIIDSRMKAIIKRTSSHVFADGQAGNVCVTLNDLFLFRKKLDELPSAMYFLLRSGHCRIPLGSRGEALSKMRNHFFE